MSVIEDEIRNEITSEQKRNMFKYQFYCELSKLNLRKAFALSRFCTLSIKWDAYAFQFVFMSTKSKFKHSILGFGVEIWHTISHHFKKQYCSFSFLPWRCEESLVIFSLDIIEDLYYFFFFLHREGRNRFSFFLNSSTMQDSSLECLRH